MLDKTIVELYWKRDPQAISETEKTYGALCRSVSYSILQSHEDAEECTNDTWYKAWETMPPQRPSSLRAYLCRIVRNLSIDRWRRRSSRKRGGGMEVLLEELEDCISAGDDVEKSVEHKELLRLVNTFLGTLPETERDLFVCRYWFFASIQELCEKFSFSESKTKSMLFRTREKLRKCLEKEGYLP